MLSVETLENHCWYFGSGRGDTLVKWYQEMYNGDGGFHAIRYHWWGSRDWPELNTGIHDHYERGGTFKPKRKVPLNSNHFSAVQPLGFYYNGDNVGRWFPRDDGGHFTVSEYGSGIETNCYRFTEFDPVGEVYVPDELSISAQQKIDEYDGKGSQRT